MERTVHPSRVAWWYGIAQNGNIIVFYLDSLATVILEMKDVLNKLYWKSD